MNFRNKAIDKSITNRDDKNLNKNAFKILSKTILESFYAATCVLNLVQ